MPSLRDDDLWPLQVRIIERWFGVRSWFRAIFLLLALAVSSNAAAAERINHAGRILGSMPALTNTVLFNTAEADAVMAAMQIFPRDNAWNEDISRRPLLANSGAMIAQIFSELNAVGTNSPKLRAFKEMNFILVPANQPVVPIQFVVYPADSDPGPYPIPSNLPIEGWPSETGTQTLAQVQRDVADEGGDRHSIILQPGSGWLWETWETLYKTTPSNHWQAANGAKFNITNNTLRPAGLTSADAAGLPMLGGLVRYDECERGEIEHALRLIVKHTRREYIYPATHHASSPSTTNPNIPAMGQRLRLKAGFAVPGNWTKQEKAIVAALKKYGGLVADNSSSFFSCSVVPDQRWPAGAFSRLTGLSITNFEVIQTTGPAEGPRSPGAPVVNAGPDQVVARGLPVTLSGALHYTNAGPVSLEWKLYSGPGAATFFRTNQTNATVTFTQVGQYVLLLRAEDSLHTPAYDAVKITVTDPIQIEIRRVGDQVVLHWTGGMPPFELQATPLLPATPWNCLGCFATNTVTLPITGAQMFFRVRGE